MAVCVLGIDIQRVMQLFVKFFKPMGFIYFNPLIFTKEKLRPREKEYSQYQMSFVGNRIKYEIFVRNGKH